MKLFRTILFSHATYIFITAAWPLIDIQSFMAVPGPKTDIWLVKTIGALLIPVSICMLSYYNKAVDSTICILGIGTATAFICIEVYYAASAVIYDIYLARRRDRATFSYRMDSCCLSTKNQRQ